MIKVPRREDNYGNEKIGGGSWAWDLQSEEPKSVLPRFKERDKEMQALTVFHFLKSVVRITREREN